MMPMIVASYAEEGEKRRPKILARSLRDGQDVNVRYMLTGETLNIGHFVIGLLN